MSIYYLGCDKPVVDPVCSDCPEKENGDIRSAFLVKRGFAFADITDPNEWTTGIQNKDIYIFPHTKGSLEVEEQVSEGFGDTLETVDSYFFTLNIMDPNYKGNFGFWNSVQGSKGWKVGYRTESYVHISEKSATIIAKAPVEEGKQSRVMWNIITKWEQDGPVEPFALPEGVFEACFEVQV